MPARALASATVSFGLVSIPVKLYSVAESAGQLSFNLLHRKCSSRLKQQYICPTDNEVVPRDDMVKGYEFAKDRYVTFTPEELKALEEESSQTIEITEFVPAARVDAIYFDKAYYLGPDKGGDKAYQLLARAMTETGRAALGKYAARGRQYLVLLRPANGGLVLQQLHYAHEIRPIAEVPIATAEVKGKELALAVQLVEQIQSDEFRPEAYRDEVRERVQGLIQKKVEGEEIAAPPAEAGGGARIIDLMEALKASLAAGPGKRARTAEAVEERKPAQRALRSVEAPARRAKRSRGA